MDMNEIYDNLIIFLDIFYLEILLLKFKLFGFALLKSTNLETIRF